MSKEDTTPTPPKNNDAWMLLPVNPIEPNSDQHHKWVDDVGQPENGKRCKQCKLIKLPNDFGYYVLHKGHFYRVSDNDALGPCPDPTMPSDRVVKSIKAYGMDTSL